MKRTYALSELTRVRYLQGVAWNITRLSKHFGMSKLTIKKICRYEIKPVKEE